MSHVVPIVVVAVMLAVLLALVVRGVRQATRVPGPDRDSDPTDGGGESGQSRD